MNIEEIIAMWSEDSHIDPFNLGNESIAIPNIHNKYYKIFLAEKAQLFNLQKQYKQLRLSKYEFYTQGPSKDQHRNWELPPIGKILKSEVNNYIEADPDISSLELKIKIQNEKVDFVESIIKSLKDRTFQIKAAIEYERFKMGSI